MFFKHKKHFKEKLYACMCCVYKFLCFTFRLEVPKTHTRGTNFE